ncbi:killer cell lectin-like receptor subfamily G member 2 isoform X4 [Orcinus orca]|uniref:killer cell lectin-like receptor subfamily G member 2 isoform X4 n=1 Tax=Orcinus orca TaxID=9733 RepID=UPI0014429173|nr:killer cell lectin-like receptor subfamily G member 2 isoform X4 [Orcinus orca]
MEGARAASGEDQDGAEFPMEPLGSRVPELEQPQVPAEERRPESPESSPSLAPAVKEEAGAGQDLSGGKKLPSPRPAPLRLLPSSPGYSAFRRQESASPELPSPGPAAAEQPRDGETPGAEQMLRAAPGEPARGAWAPMELQVDVRVKSVGAAGSSCAPSPAPSTRFLTVPVPESPAFSHHASPAHPLLRLTPSPGGTWGRGTPLAAARTERDLDAEGWAGPAEGRAESPGSPTCRCRGKEDAVLHAEMDGDKKLSRVIKLVGARCQPCPQGWMWSMEHCYYLSAEAEAWEASQAFCSAHHATLPLLRHTQDFLSRYPVTKYSWVGARRGPQGWHWIDGTPLPPQLLPEEDQQEPDLNCGGLEGGKFVASDCASPRPWVCARGTK